MYMYATPHPINDVSDSCHRSALEVRPPPPEVDEDVVRHPLLKRLLAAVHVLSLAPGKSLTRVGEELFSDGV